MGTKSYSRWSEQEQEQGSEQEKEQEKRIEKEQEQEQEPEQEPEQGDGVLTGDVGSVVAGVGDSQHG